MNITGKEADITLARLERFLAIALFPNVGSFVFGMGLVLFLTGASVWMALSGWVSLLGANLVYMGGIIGLLGLEVRGNPERLPLTPLVGLLGWFLLRRVVSFFLILEQRAAIAMMGRLGALDFITCCSRAELIGALGVLGFWCGWRLARQGREVRASVAPMTLSVDRRMWGGYLFGLVIYMLILNVPGFGRLGSFGAALCTFPQGVAFCVVALHAADGSLATIIKSVALMMPFSLHIMGTGMKTAFLNPFLPAFHGTLLKNIRLPLIYASVLLIFLLLFVYPYINSFRKEIWGAGRAVSETELAQQVWDEVSVVGYGRALRRSYQDFQSRYSSIGIPGMIVDIVYDEGHVGGMFLKNLSYAFIPRLLWPNKPRFEASGWLTMKLSGQVSGLEYEDLISGTNVSSTAFHLPMEWYWMFGWAGVFFGLALTGYGYAWAHRYLLIHAARSPIFLAGWYLLFAFVCKLEEVRSTTTFQQPVIILAAIWAMYGLTRLIPSQPAPYAPVGGPVIRG